MTLIAHHACKPHKFSSDIHKYCLCVPYEPSIYATRFVRLYVFLRVYRSSSWWAFSGRENIYVFTNQTGIDHIDGFAFMRKTFKCQNIEHLATRDFGV